MWQWTCRKTVRNSECRTTCSLQEVHLHFGKSIPENIYYIILIHTLAKLTEANLNVFTATPTVWLGGKSVLIKYCQMFSVCVCSWLHGGADFESNNQLSVQYSQILFMETLRVSSFGQPVRKSGEIFSTLFLLTSSVLISGRHSGTQSSVILLLKRKRREITVVCTILQLDGGCLITGH